MKVLFLDRDGTLIHEPNDRYINSLKKLKINPHGYPTVLKYTLGSIFINGYLQ